MSTGALPNVDRGVLRDAIQCEYDLVAREPHHGFHFHTGRPLAALLGYDAAQPWTEGLWAYGSHPSTRGFRSWTALGRSGGT